jgi:hypothetical protein
MEWQLICLISICSASMVPSFLILYLLISIKYKDFTIFLKIELIVYDILQEISTIIACFETPGDLIKFSHSQASSLCLFLYVKFIHSALILYMAWVIYKAITQKTIISNKVLLKFTIISNLLAITVVITYLISLSAFPASYFSIYKVFFYFCIDFPSIIIGFVLIWFYYHIRKTLKEELLSTIPVVQQKRSIAKQLIFTL